MCFPYCARSYIHSSFRQTTFNLRLQLTAGKVEKKRRKLESFNVILIALFLLLPLPSLCLSLSLVYTNIVKVHYKN